MQTNNILFPEDIYVESLSTIGGVKFTRREVEILSCLLNARGTSKIASFLSISLRTVVTHIRNIMLKLECNSRESIVDFIEKSPKVSILRDYYASLVTERVFEKSLIEISKLKREEDHICLTVYLKDSMLKDYFLRHLGNHLTRVGFKTEVQEHRLGQEVEPPEHLNHTLVVLTEKKYQMDIFGKSPTFQNIDLSELQNYYSSFFEILKKLLPKVDLENIFKNFRECTEGLQNFPKKVDYKIDPYNKHTNNNKNLIILKNKKYLYFFVFCFFIVTAFVYVILNYKGHYYECQPQIKAINIKKNQIDPIQSDLSIPSDSILLSRSILISQINEKFKEQPGIQTVALVGPGGAGKTTLARLYARHQTDKVIWEVNGETKGSLKESFENLAQALAITKEDKKILSEVKGTKNPVEREEKIIQFVKKLLSSHLSWILIFDNVEKFSDIQKYFPKDFGTWGQGRVILTTRDSNIENNAHVNDIIQVGELDSTQKLALFMKIRDHGNANTLTVAQREEIKAFLEKIPPFPLDISIAAYYLTTTNISFTAYIEKLARHDKDFEDVQENLLKEGGFYTKTRYGIITLSLENIIDSHKDFRDLLLFISLLDSQNISRDLLDKYKNSSVVDSFIYVLKGHSLITNESVGALSTFSVHRSTQAITIAYLIKLLDLENNKHLIKDIGVALKNYVVEAIDKEDFSKMIFLIRHCKIFLSHTKLLTDFVKASISSELGNIYRDLGNYKKASQLLEQSVILYKKNHYENHHWFARALAGLGNVYNHSGDYKKAKQFLEESLKIYRKNSYENHPWFARALGWLGTVYKEQGNQEKAKLAFEECVVIYKNNSYESHPWCAWALENLGTVFKELGNYEKAKQLLEESLAIYRKNSFEKHHWYGRALSWLASIHRELGHYEKAKQLFEESLKIYKNSTYENHPWLARTLSGLGSVHRELGNYEKAKQLLEESLAIYKKNSFKNNHWFARAVSSLGSVYRDLGNHEAAKQLLEESLVIYRKISFENHPWYARTLGCLGKVYKELGNNKKAKQLLEESLIVYKKNSYENHPWYARVLHLLGTVYRDLGNFKKAKQLLEHSFQIYEKINGKEHINTAQALMNIGIVYMLENNIKAAENFLNLALRVYERTKHPESYICLEALAELHLKKSKYLRENKQSKSHEAQAIFYLKKALEILKTHSRENSSHYKRIQLKLKNLSQSDMEIITLIP